MSSSKDIRSSKDAKNTRKKTGNEKNIKVQQKPKQGKKEIIKNNNKPKRDFKEVDRPKLVSREIKTSNEEITKETLDSLRFGDPRSPYGPKQAVQNNINIEYVSHGSSVVVPLSDIAIVAVASSLVSKALVKGLDESYAGPALQQISEILKNAAINAEPVVMDIPGYLQLICSALSPKTVLHKGAAFNYSWSSNGSNITALQQLPYGNTNNSGVINYGMISENNSGPLGLPMIVQGPPPTDDQKKLAFSKFTSALAEGDNGTSKPLNKGELKKILRDTSAFAGQTIIDGFAIGGQGGTIVRLGSEATLGLPVFGRFAEVKSSYRDYNRACNENIEAGGGPMELGMFSLMYRIREFAKVMKPVIKFIDFDCLVHIYLVSWIESLNVYTRSHGFVTIASINGSEADKNVRARCIPATFMEVQLVLRNEFMKVFAETQHGTQSLGPSTNAAEAWLGFACGVGTTPNFQVESLYMPGPYIENLRALASVTVYDVKDVPLYNVLKAAKKNRQLTPEEQKMWDDNKIIRPYLPVLGSYLNGGLIETDYTVTYNGGLTIPLFQPPVNKKIEVPNSPNLFKKGNRSAKDGQPIRINDGSTGNGYVALNDPAVIGEIAQRINRTMLMNAKYVAGLRQNVAAPAAACLRQLGCCIYAIRNLDVSQDGSYLDNLLLQKITYGYMPEKVIEEQFRFFKGFSIVDASKGTGQLKANNDRETEEIVVGTVTEPVTMRSYLGAVAKLNVADGETTNLSKKLDMLDADGKGGIFSDIANALSPVAQVVLPMAGGFADGFFG